LTERQLKEKESRSGRSTMTRNNLRSWKTEPRETKMRP